MWTAWCGHSPKKVHLHIRRYEKKDVPKDSKDFVVWCNQKWKEKDQLLQQFQQKNQFSTNSRNWKSDSLSWKIRFFFVFWLFLLPFLFYVSFFVSKWITLYTILAWCFYVASSFSERIRIWRGLNVSLHKKNL